MQDEFFSDLRLMIGNALKFHKVESHFHALSLKIQKYIEDNIVQIQRRLSDNDNNCTRTHPETNQQHLVDENMEGGLLEASCVKARPLSEAEKEGLMSSVAELFKVILLVYVASFSFSFPPSLSFFFY